ncbi:hypothetical protein ACFFGH_06540 [Lysobacter korlensis]|uniref:Uncharacterized protein n=1 Tax=Lysobacter korlensis TaxID=553636 RepID=A0ABV6RKJ4_9GAMM
MTLNPALETALYSEDFMADFDRLLQITGTKLRLVWDGPRDRDVLTLWLIYDGLRAPLAQYKPQWPGFAWAAGVAKVEDFRERLDGLLRLHNAEVGLLINRVRREGKFGVAFPHAPQPGPGRVHSRAIVTTRRSTAQHECSGEYAPPNPEEVRQ